MAQDDKLEMALSAGSTESTESTNRPKSKRRKDSNIRTYYSTPELRSRLARLRQDWELQSESELTRWLLTSALDLVDKGKLKPKIKTVQQIDL